jgi:hypothetical protein
MRSALLDRRLITEISALLSQPERERPAAGLLSLLMCHGLTIYDELVIEKTYSSTLQSIVHRANADLGERLLFARAPGVSSEDFRFALDDAVEEWAQDPRFQIVVGRYERKKGSGAEAAADAIGYVQHVLVASNALASVYELSEEMRSKSPRGGRFSVGKRIA